MIDTWRNSAEYALNQMLSRLAYLVHIHEREHDVVYDRHPFRKNLEMSLVLVADQTAVGSVVTRNGRLRFVIPLQLEAVQKSVSL